MSMFRFQVSQRIPLGNDEVVARFSGSALEMTGHMSNVFALTAATVNPLDVYFEVLLMEEPYPWPERVEPLQRQQQEQRRHRCLEEWGLPPSPQRLAGRLCSNME